MNNFDRFMISFETSLLAALFVNLVILFTIPPTTTQGIIAKDALSLVVFGVIFFIFFKRKR